MIIFLLSWSILHKERQKIVSFLRIFDVQFQFVCAVIFYYTSYHFQIYEVESSKTTGNTILWLSMVHLLVRVLFLYQHCVDPKHSLIEMITLIFDCIIKLTIISYYGMETTIMGNNPEERFFFLRLIIIGKEWVWIEAILMVYISHFNWLYKLIPLRYSSSSRRCSSNDENCGENKVLHDYDKVLEHHHSLRKSLKHLKPL